MHAAQNIAAVSLRGRWLRFNFTSASMVLVSPGMNVLHIAMFTPSLGQSALLNLLHKLLEACKKAPQALHL